MSSCATVSVHKHKEHLAHDQSVTICWSSSLDCGEFARASTAAIYIFCLGRHSVPNTEVYLSSHAIAYCKFNAIEQVHMNLGY